MKTKWAHQPCEAVELRTGARIQTRALIFMKEVTTRLPEINIKETLIMKTINPLRISLVLIILFSLVLAACATTSAPQNPDVILATTTSTRDSGLLDVLVPDFEGKTGYVIKTIAVGTGQALEMGRAGDADLLFVHAPASEKEFMDGGYGSERFLVMHNDFVIVGPEDDPAGIRGTAIAAEALTSVAAAEAPFISRGDDSGTHKKELALWADAGITPQGDWYQESGQGMAATLTIASEKQAYTLTDRASYLHNRDTLDLEILVEGDNVLLNVYHVIIVNPEKWPLVNEAGARAFAQYLVDPDTQAMIGEYGVDRFGQPLFTPDADKTDADLGLE